MKAQLTRSPCRRAARGKPSPSVSATVATARSGKASSTGASMSFERRTIVNVPSGATSPQVR